MGSHAVGKVRRGSAGFHDPDMLFINDDERRIKVDGRDILPEEAGKSLVNVTPTLIPKTKDDDPVCAAILLVILFAESLVKSDDDPPLASGKRDDLRVGWRPREDITLVENVNAKRLSEKRRGIRRQIGVEEIRTHMGRESDVFVSRSMRSAAYAMAARISSSVRSG